MRRFAMEIPLALVLTVLTVPVVRAQDPIPTDPPDPAPFDTVLARFVQDGMVDYSALAANRAPLDRYLDRLASVRPEAFQAWPERERIAFLINAYNAYMLETVIDNYPIEGGGLFAWLFSPSNSVRRIDGVFDGIEHRVAGRLMTLDEIEHERLRVHYDEPRIHLALVCAAMSCPPLRGEAYRGDRLDAQLDEQGRAFLNDPERNRYDQASGRVYLSKIFDWYGEDFRGLAPAEGYRGDEELRGVLAFVARYVPEPVTEFLRRGDYRVEFLDYDWTLNDQAIETASR